MENIQYTIFDQTKFTGSNLQHIRMQIKHIVGEDFLDNFLNIRGSGPSGNLLKAISRDNTFSLYPQSVDGYPIISQFSHYRIGDVIDEVIIDFGRCALYLCQVVTEWKNYDGIGLFVLDKTIMEFFFYSFLVTRTNQSLMNYIFKSI